MKRIRRGERLLAAALSVLLVVGGLPAVALAEGQIGQKTGVCEHHTEHNADCGYAEGRPCEHKHTEDCYELFCLHDEEEETIASGSEAVYAHTQECYDLVCSHELGEHDADCGYVQAQPCGYICELCGKPADEPEDGTNQDDCTLTGDCILSAGHEGGCEAEQPPADGVPVKTVIRWTFVDGDNLSGGELALGGASLDQQVDFDAVVSMLPTAISAELGEETVQVAIAGWDCPEYIKGAGGDWPIDGQYIFKAKLPDGYACDTPPSVKVLVGGTGLYADTTGGFSITGGSLDSDYIYQDNILTIQTGTELTISGGGGEDRIRVKSGTKANITLNGVQIDVQNTDGACAFDMTGAEVMLNLEEGSSNTLSSHASRAGLEAPKGSTLTITGNGFLHAVSVDGAGIGGGIDGEGGTISIRGNTQVQAESQNGAGIGGGKGGTHDRIGQPGGAGGTITIEESARVIAESQNGAGIGGGVSGIWTYNPGGSSGSPGGKSGTIVIKGDAEVSAESHYGAGIGGGSAGNDGDGGGCESITIQDRARVKAASREGAGVGGGASDLVHHHDGGNTSKIIIKDNVEVTATSEKGAGIGGGAGVKGGGTGFNIKIHGNAEVTAESKEGAGIGGGFGIGEGGGGRVIYIESDARIKATSEDGAGIGGGSSSGQGGWGHEMIMDNNVQVMASSKNGNGIGGGRGDDKDGETFRINKDGGIIFENGTGQVYGDVTISSDLEIPKDHTLLIPEGSQLTVPEDVTLNIQGTIDNQGSLVNNGTVSGDGTLTGGGALAGGGVFEQKAERSIDAPAIRSITRDGVVLSETVPSGDGTVTYGKNTENTAPGNNQWQASPVFTGLAPGVTYYFFARVTGGARYKDAVSTGQEAAILKIDEDPVYSVTVETAGSGTAGAAPASASEGTTVTLSVEAGSGYRFKEWQVVSGGVSITENQFTMPAGDVVVRAVFEKNISGSGGNSSGRSSVTAPKGSYTVAGDTISLNLSRSDLQGLVNSGKGLTIQSGAVGINFEPAALNAILEAVPDTAGQTIVTASPADISAFPDAARLIGSRPVYDIAIAGKDSGGNIVPAEISFPAGSAAIFLNYIPDSAEVTGNLFLVYVDGDGTVKWLDKSSYADGKVLAEIPHFSVYGVAYQASVPVFDDIAGHWAQGDIEFAAARNLFSDTGTNRFSPDGAMTRGMFVTALGRLAGIAPEDFKARSFTDVKADAYYAAYVEWAVQKKILTGADDNLFYPEAPVTREQMAAALANYAGQMGYSIPAPLASATFADNDKISAWAAKGVAAMQRAGIIRGKDGNRFDPQANATRAEGAAALQRFVETMADPDAASGWGKNDSGHWIYNKDGKALTGWQTIGKLRYYFNPDGVMYEGWKQDTETASWYYWTNTGAAVGWKKIDGKWYYFNRNGVMAVNTKIDGYDVGPDGARQS